MTDILAGDFGAESEIVDYILGITFEIWEQGGVALCKRYYSDDVLVYTLEGITEGSAAIVEGTRKMLASFPDRLLLADDVIWSGNRSEGFLSSHRILSPMTNRGASAFGPATGKHVRIMNIADCFVEKGVITREWLVRDNHALVTQLGFNARIAAEEAAGRRDARSLSWIASEIDRLHSAGRQAMAVEHPGAAGALAHRVLAAQWVSGDARELERRYAPYAVLHRSPIALFSGRGALLGHYAALRNAFRVEGLTVDHVAALERGPAQQDIAVRWTLAGEHVGEYLGLPASGRQAFILGVTHWRVIDGRVAVEWTVFDSLGVLSQLV